MVKIFPYWLVLISILGVFSSCGPAKRLADDEVFLRKNEIVFEEDDDRELDREELNNIIKQKPNRKILFFRFNLAMYNMVDPEKRKRKHEKKVDRVIRRIDKLIEKEENCSKEKKKKRLNARITKLQTEEVRTLKDWWAETVGEKPVALDSVLVDKSQKQLEVYLSKQGYFDNDVNSSIIFNKHNKRKAIVQYSISPGEPYTYNNITYEIEDEDIQSKLGAIKNISLLKSGDRFNVDVMDEDREALTAYLNDRGYFAFVKNYVRYEVDSTGGNNQVDLFILVNAPKYAQNDSIYSFRHQKFFIGDIFVHTDYDALSIDYSPEDTLFYNGLHIVYNDLISIKPKMLDYNIELYTGQMYQKSVVETTYKRFTSLGIFDGVNIEFFPREENNQQILDCHIKLTPAKKQSFEIQGTGTHRDGSLGVFGSMAYRHNNMFAGAESGEVKLSAGFESNQSVTTTLSDDELDLNRNLSLNTFEIGPEVSVYLHNLFPYPKSRLTKSNEPKTKITAAYNFQSRPDFIRTITQFIYSGSFVENKEKGSSFRYDLFNFSFVDIEKTTGFQEFLDELDNPVLTASYNNHLISAGKLSWVKNTQKTRNQRKYIYFKPSFEFSGMSLRAFHNLTGKGQNENGSYEILDIPYANYTRFDADFRTYFQSNYRNRFAFRAFAGLGQPLWNLDVLPFEKSFFSGGSNGIRAWQARTLGPGSFRDNVALLTFNRLGDIKLETSFEYRFRMTPMFEGAIFLDAGNIWLIEEDSFRPGSGFQRNEFISEIAIGSGLGFRFDFDYFLVRFDFGVQLKDPAKIKGERWAWEPKDEFYEYSSQFYPDGIPPNFFPAINFNLGIGYPF